MERIKGLLAVMAGAGLVLAAGSVQAAESKVTIVNAPGKMDAMKVVRDKQTGRIRAATPEEIEELNAARTSYAPSPLMLSRPATTMVQRPDGSATIRRGADELDEIVVSKGADGKLNMGHKHAAPSTQPKE